MNIVLMYDQFDKSIFRKFYSTFNSNNKLFSLIKYVHIYKQIFNISVFNVSISLCYKKKFYSIKKYTEK